ncbi:MAG: alpha/beta fold hydrolase [Gemmatimonadales bacterium]
MRILPAVALATALGACNRAPPVPRVTEGLHAINGTELFVKRIGAGEPIVVVHGGPVLEHGYLLPHLAPLAESYELIFYDQRLSGRSAPHVDSSTVRIGTFVDDIESLRTSLGLGRIHLMAHSWGGLLAMYYALEHEANLRSLVLLDAMAPSSKQWQEEEKILAQRITPADKAARRAITETDAFARRDPAAVEQLLRLSFKTQFHDPSKLAHLKLFVPDDYAERSRQFGHMMVDLTNFDLQNELSRLTVPTLIMYGSDEPGRELGGAALHEALPSAQFVVVENAGHFPFIDHQAQFLGVVREFLRTNQ